MKRRAAFIGRFQPWHNGHEWLISQKLKKGVPVLIMVRDTPVSDKNPFSTADVVYLIRKVYEGEDVVVFSIPDIESVNYGRGVGYEINEFEPPVNIERISATEIRNCIATGDESWKKKVNEKIWDDVIQALGNPV
jgi:nicotinamide mononucleotide adenylyltransferase